jgi:Zn-dependent M28 family amino/carboxypeptidase
MKFFAVIFFIFNLFLLSAQDFKKHVFAIANDSFMGRPAGSVYENRALEYITNTVKIDFNVQVQDFEFRNFEGKLISSRNILAFSKHNNENDSLIVLMAHYDHLNIGDAKSKEVLISKKNQIHNGADDNASGVAMVLELGKYFSKKKNLNNNLLLLFTSAHEPGLFGAKDFTLKNKLSELKIKSVYNFDMVGRLDESTKIIGVSFTKNQVENLNEIALKHGLNISNDNLIEYSDLKFFQNSNISLMNITTGIHEDYHRITDDSEKINFKGMKMIFNVFKKYILVA